MSGSNRTVVLLSARVLKLTTVVLLLGLVVFMLTACGQQSGNSATSSAPSAESQFNPPGSATTGGSSPAVSEAGGTEGEGSAGQGASAAKGAISARQAMDLLLPKAKEWAQHALLVILAPEPRGGTVEAGLWNYWSATIYSPSSRTVYSSAQGVTEIASLELSLR